MAAARCVRILLLASVLAGLLRESPCRSLHRPGTGGAGAQRRPRRGGPEGRGSGHCAPLAAPWAESVGPAGDRGLSYRVRVLPGFGESRRRAVFIEQPLFRFVRRVYRCCQAGHRCGGVKGIQGRMSGDMEFVLSDDVLAKAVTRAEIHLQLSNPLQLNVLPLLSYLELPTRYHLWPGDKVLQLKVDLLFLFQALQQVAGGARGGPSLIDIRRVGGLTRPGATKPQEWDLSLQNTIWGEGDDRATLSPALELGLVLQCSSAGRPTPCESNGLKLMHTPFIALSYR
uniref:Uncharacterized protein n=1 Tax=Denticeps clupeoides TaxID=299321 RepID=A0AAY4CXX5_9TELE